MFIAIFLLILSPYTAIIPGMYATVGVLTKKFRIYLNPWNIGLLTLFFIAIVAGLLNKSLLSALSSLMLFMYFCISIAMEYSFSSEDKVIKFYLVLLYFSIIPGILGIAEKICYQWFNIALIKRVFFVTSDLNGRIYSTFANPNIAGGWFAAMLLIAVFLWGRREIKSKLLHFMLIMLYSVNLLLTGSRGAMMGLVAAATVLVIMKSGWRKLIVPGAILSIVVVICLIPSSSPFIDSLMGHEVSSSFSSRYPIWKGCIEMIFEKPMLGWGLMGVLEKGSIFFDGGITATHAHNAWLSILSSLGLMGFYVYLVMKAYIIYGLGTLQKNNCSLTPLLASIQMLVVVHGVVDFTICVPQTGILFISCSAFIVSLSRSFSTIPHFQQFPVWPVGMTSRYRAE